MHIINDAGYHIEETDKRPEFLLMRPYIHGLGIDIGCGSNRLSPTVLTTDWYPHADTDLIWKCDLEIDGIKYFQPYPFSDGRFDFVFASHVLEDFEPEFIQPMFDECLRLLKVGGYLITLGPDMENNRYPKWDEVFTEEHEEVKSGKRKVGELIGNPSHRFDWGLTKCHELMNNSKYKMEIAQEDTIPHHSTMTLDFVVKKL